MAGEEISPELKRFIQGTIESVEQLEVLVFLMSNTDRDWSVEELVGRVRLTPEAVALRVAELGKARLVRSEGGFTPRYRYAPDSDALQNEVAESLNRAFLEKKDTLIKLIFTRPKDNIRIFADAFRLRSDD